MPLHRNPLLPDRAPRGALHPREMARLGELFARAVGIALGLSGCSDSVPPCDSAMPLPLEGLKPAEPVDYIGVGTIINRELTSDVSESARRGAPCSGASDRAACLEALTSARNALDLTDSCIMVGPCRNYIVTSAGDSVDIYASDAEILAFLGPLDSNADVLLWLNYKQRPVQCDNTEVEKSGPGFEVSFTESRMLCPAQDKRVTVRVDPDGTIHEVAEELGPRRDEPCVVPGRRPEGLCPLPQREQPLDLGAYFASMAHFEAASVAAFEILARELAHHDAPAELVNRARTAAREELRHAQLTAAVAARFGGSPAKPAIEPRALRTLEQIALDNATEGAVRETFSAALAAYQARAALDPQIARVMQQLAIDEMSHAALSLAIDAWVRPRLDEAARARVAAAQAEAVVQLGRDCARPQPLSAAAGLPTREARVHMHRALASELWA